MPPQQGKRARDEESEDIEKALFLSRGDSAPMEASPGAAALGPSSDLAAAAMVDLTRPDKAEEALLRQVRAGFAWRICCISSSRHMHVHAASAGSALLHHHAAKTP